MPKKSKRIRNVPALAVCEHGSLKRKCEICKRDDQIAKLTIEANQWRNLYRTVKPSKELEAEVAGWEKVCRNIGYDWNIKTWHSVRVVMALNAAGFHHAPGDTFKEPEGTATAAVTREDGKGKI